MCKAFVIVANEEYVQEWQMKSVQSFCYCGE